MANHLHVDGGINLLLYFLNGNINGTKHGASRYSFLVDFWMQIKLTQSTVCWAKRFVNINTIFIIFIPFVQSISDESWKLQFLEKTIVRQMFADLGLLLDPLSAFVITMSYLFFNICKADFSSLVRLSGTTFQCLTQQPQCKTEVLHIFPMPVP